MKDKNKTFLIFIFTILTILSILLFSIASNINLNDNKKNSDIQPTNSNENSIINIKKKIEFSKPETQKKGNYLELIDEKASSFTLEDGKIRVPVYTLSFQLPLGCKITNFSFKPSEINQISLSNNIKPVSNPLYTLSYDKQEVFFLQEDKETAIYPSNWYINTTGGGIYNNRLTSFFNIHIFPQRYSENEDTLSYIQDATISFCYENKSMINHTNETYDYLIITTSDFQSSIQPLTKHKEEFDLKLKIVNLQEIINSKYFKVKGRDIQEQIKYFIKNSIENWNVKYVLLLGDHEKIPVRYIHIAANLSNDSQMPLASISDLYYSDIYYANASFCSWDSNNNNTFGEYNWGGSTENIDFYPDVYLGRIPAKQKKDVQTIVDKIIKYEKDENKDNWFNNMIHCGGDTFPPIRTLLSISQFKIRNMFHMIKYEKDEIFSEEGVENCEIVSDIMKEFNHKKIYSYIIKPSNDFKPLLNMYITQAINEGAGFLYFAGHGNPTTYATYKTPSIIPYRKRPFFGFTTTQVSMLKNNEKLPVVIFDACSCGKFDEKKCIAWDIINNENAGAIASYGCTNLSFGRLGSYNTEGLNGYMAIKLFENYAKGYNKPGIMLAQGQIDYLNQISKLSYMDYLIISMWELFGDPSLQIK